MRTEHDFLGDREIPDDVYYGVQTLRALENFHITGVPISHTPSFIAGLGYVKKAAALANRDCGVLDVRIADAIIGACDAVIDGVLDNQFVVDVIQGGAGTSTNMNANEVIANKALELLGEPKGKYEVVHPNDHVNLSQSTNDAYPSAFRITLYREMETLIDALALLQGAFEDKGREFADILKMGRTQLQDAVPMTLGQEFDAFAVNVGEDIKRLQEARDLVTEINLGATAIGTSINAPAGYPPVAVKHLAEITGIPLTLSQNLIEATWDTGAYVQISGVLKRVAIKLSKICNDLRLLSSGPRTGINEINLPKLQPGSSIMPGKVNPVIPEVVNQVCFLVIGNDVTVSFAAEAGQLQLNVMEPVIAHCLFESIGTLTRACHTLRTKCVTGITANPEHARTMVLNSIGIVTALNPILGYEVSASIAKEAYETGGNIIDIVRQRKLLSEEKIAEVFSLDNLMHPRFIR
ncbi:MAG: aspartate ammonia-lyase ['Candidatus Kapabacteria' thiocyanatum]|uniref:Aspartate ammonia-lyase n=1 Tax=Candidatus Kapaibacterium thiocyanatum TaxID=1895771 RepID=A0A1M3KXS1_9BACT|nr:aspartate ammonia-lyase ['Candidatus Kapabacteria' thiocyanatum]OJX57246.1 MAG: aspartate ammonia-lyase ['Candidatus Kapabacteria' thiocyanatum]